MISETRPDFLVARCSNYESCLTERGGVILGIPRKVFDKDGELRRDFEGRILDNGVFVSNCGYFYCSRECWSTFCED